MDDREFQASDYPSIDLGPCCYCESTGDFVRNVYMVDKLSPIPGRGWGCFVCGFPLDGASYVLCDDCHDAKREPKFACRGYPWIDGRVPFEELERVFKHDESRHPELNLEV